SPRRRLGDQAGGAERVAHPAIRLVGDPGHAVEADAGGELAHLLVADDARVGAELALHLDDAAHRGHVLRRHEPDAAAAIEPGRVGAVDVAEIQPGGERLHAQPDLDLRPEVRADEPTALAAGAGSDGSLLQQDDLLHTTSGEVESDVRAVDSTTDDYRVGRLCHLL